MNRRDALRMLATAAALPLAPRPLMAVLRKARILVDASAAQHTLSAHQGATVKAMCEMILPKTDTPGATDVGASDFIELMLTEWYDEPVRSMFLRGLADVDARTQTLFGKDFVEASAIQQSEILTALGENMLQDLEPARERPQTTRRAPVAGADRNFYVMLRRLTLTAYYTSETGATAGLHYEIVPDHYGGCEGVNAGKETEKIQ